MNLVDRHGNLLSGNPQHARIASKARLTRDVDEPISSGLSAVVAPTDDADWRIRRYSQAQLDNMPLSEVLEILIDASPDLDRALHDIRMNVNTSYTLNVVEDNSTGAEAMQILRDALDQMRMTIGEPIEVKIDKMVSSSYLKGAIYGEIIFDGQDFVDVVINDPLRARFVRDRDDVRGQHWIRGEMQNGEFVEIDSENVFYVPFNAVEDRPYGRSMVTSAIDPILNQKTVMSGAFQAFMSSSLPHQVALLDRLLLKDAGLTNEQIKDELKATEQDIRTQFSQAKPGTQFVFGSETKFETIGDSSRQRYDGVQMLTKSYERKAQQGSKTVPTVSGFNEGNALSNDSDQQLEVWATFIDGLQSRKEDVWEYIFIRILREKGNAATPIFELKRNTSFVEKIRAERQQIKTESIDKWYAAGVITPQEYRELLRNPDAFDKLSEILDPELDSQFTRESIESDDDESMREEE